MPIQSSVNAINFPSPPASGGEGQGEGGQNPSRQPDVVARTATPSPPPLSLEAGERGDHLRCRTAVWAFAIVSILGSVARAADAPTRRAEFVLHTISGNNATGMLQQLGQDWSVALAGEKPVRIAGADVVALRRAHVALPPFPQQPHVVLAGGDFIPGTLQSLTAETLRFRAACGKEREFRLPLSAVSLLWRAPPEGTGHPEVFRRRLAAQKRKHDRVYLRNGDILEGVVNSIDEAKLRLEINRKEVSVDLKERVAVIAFSTDLVRQPTTKLPYAQAVLANGGRVSLASAEADAHELRGATVLGAAVRIPIEQIAALNLRNNRVVYLSDLKPTRYEFTPFLDERWPFVRDGNVLGRDLQMRGDTYDKGLGIHSASRLTFDLAGSYQRFEALVGLDDAAGAQANAGIQVLIDGKTRELTPAGPNREATERELRPKQPAIPLNIDVRGARELTLVVTFGRHGNVQDYVDWADARLIR